MLITKVPILCQLEVDLNSASAAGYAPLHLAAASGRTSAATALISMGADPNTAARTGDTALHLACHGGHATSVSCPISISMDLHWYFRAGGEPGVRKCKLHYVECVWSHPSGSCLPKWTCSGILNSHVVCASAHSECNIPGCESTPPFRAVLGFLSPAL